MNLSKTKFSVLLIVILFLSILSGWKNSSVLINRPIPAYDDYPILTITGNSDFLAKAILYGWIGDGTPNFPICITAINITSSSGTETLLSISHTSLHFNITHSYFSGGLYGIALLNVTNSLILNNTVIGAASSGIFVMQSFNLKFENDTTSSHAQNGFYLYETNETIIYNCTVCNNGEVGILADYTEDVEIKKNTIYLNGREGVNIREGEENSVLQNDIYQCGSSFFAINFGDSDYNSVQDNYIHNNSHGIQCGASDYITIFRNAIYDNAGDGILVQSHSNVSLNTFYRNGRYGVNSQGTNTTIMNNNFIRNNYHPEDPFWFPQSSEHGIDNNYTHNFWDHWTVPDENFDDIVDIPYPLIMDPAILDEYPHTKVFVNNLLHLLMHPKLIYPNIENYIRGLVNITWGSASDTFGHEINYSIYYSLNNGSSWNLIQNNIQDTHLLWDCSIIVSNQYTRIKVEAKCAEDLISSDSSDEYFAIANIEHTLSVPTILYPLEGNIVEGIVQIEWEATIDSWYLPITYNLYFLNGESEWDLLASNIEETQYIFNSTEFEDGDFILMVIAYSLEDLQSNATSGVFIIDNEPDPRKIPGFHIETFLCFLFLSVCALVLIYRKNKF